jgi:hypothetical protein
MPFISQIKQCKGIWEQDNLRVLTHDIHNKLHHVHSKPNNNGNLNNLKVFESKETKAHSIFRAESNWIKLQ